jgi:hypothetical protein
VIYVLILMLLPTALIGGFDPANEEAGRYQQPNCTFNACMGSPQQAREFCRSKAKRVPKARPVLTPKESDPAVL